MSTKLRGYDSSALFREDTLIRIRRLNVEIADIAKKMNEIIQKEELPVELAMAQPSADDENDEE